MTWIEESLSRLCTELHVRRMFGGYGIYEGEHFFAIVHRDRFYLKVDDEMAKTLSKLGSKPFQPSKKQTLHRYYDLPIDVLENSQELRHWTLRSIACAQNQIKKRKS